MVYYKLTDKDGYVRKGDRGETLLSPGLVMTAKERVERGER